MSDNLEAWAQVNVSNKEFITMLKARGWTGEHTMNTVVQIRYFVEEKEIAHVRIIAYKEIKRYIRVKV